MLLSEFGLIGSVPYHLSFATRDLEEAEVAFTALFDLRWSPVLDAMDSGLGLQDGTRFDGWACRRITSLGGPIHYELSEGSEGSIWHTDQLATLHHLAYWCEDLRATMDQLEGDGWTVEATLVGDEGEPREFAYVSKPSWPRLELVDVARQERFVDAHAHHGPARRNPC